jgi:hypothetical protein
MLYLPNSHTETYSSHQVQLLFPELLFTQYPLPFVRLRLHVLYSQPGLHHDLLGISHHMDPLKHFLMLCSSVKDITSFSEMDVQHHT